MLNKKGRRREEKAQEKIGYVFIVNNDNKWVTETIFFFALLSSKT